MSPQYCLGIRHSPITGSSPYLPNAPIAPTPLHAHYQPFLGILPTGPKQPQPTAGAKAYKRHETIAPVSPEDAPRSKLTSNYQPLESIIPMSPPPPGLGAELEENPSSSRGSDVIGKLLIHCI